MLRKPIVTLQPRTYKDLKKGIDVIANAIRPTLGPLPRITVLERLKRTDVPEFLDDGAMIARRIIEISPRGCDVGAMLLRHALWQMHDEAGDGTTTMAVMYQAIVQEGIRYITQYHCNAMLLRTGLEKGLKVVLTAVNAGMTPLSGKTRIENIARGMCQGDAEMASILAEIFDIVGPDGLIVVEGYDKSGLEREYIEGTYWKLSGWFSRVFVTDLAEKRTVYDDAAILISDIKLMELAQLIPAMERCIKAGIKKLVIIASEVSDTVIGLVAKNNTAKTIESMIVRTPRVGEMERVANMEDIAALTGGKIFYSAAFSSFEDFRVEDLGHARRAWATESLFGIYGGKGDPRKIRKHIAAVRSKLILAENDRDRGDVQMRIGRLNGGTVIFRVGGIHEVQREARKAVAERAITGIRNAILGGVVLGGGAALINAQSALQAVQARNDDEALAFRILSRALEEPLRTIAYNAGHVPDVIVERVHTAASGYGFDARSGKIVDLRQAGILDAAIVLGKALEIAVSGAAMVLTTDVIVHHAEPKESLEP
jgi:chaperonin GroEL